MLGHNRSNTGNRMLVCGVLISSLGMALYLLVAIMGLLQHPAIAGISLTILGGGVMVWFAGAYRCLKFI